MKILKEKTPSQNMRAIIYLHHQFDCPEIDFEEYYKEKMNVLNKALLKKLEDKKMGILIETRN